METYHSPIFGNFASWRPIGVRRLGLHALFLACEPPTPRLQTTDKRGAMTVGLVQRYEQTGLTTFCAGTQSVRRSFKTHYVRLSCRDRVPIHCALLLHDPPIESSPADSHFEATWLEEQGYIFGRNAKTSRDLGSYEFGL